MSEKPSNNELPTKCYWDGEELKNNTDEWVILFDSCRSRVGWLENKFLHSDKDKPKSPTIRADNIRHVLNPNHIAALNQYSIELESYNEEFIKNRDWYDSLYESNLTQYNDWYSVKNGLKTY